MDLKVKRCEQAACGREFSPKPGRGHASVWEKRRYCSQSCAGRASAKPIENPVKVCANPDCRKEFGITKGRGPGQWAARRFCSQKCGSYMRTRRLIEDVEWIIDHDHPESVARRVGYSSVDSLVGKLHRNGADALAEKLVRNIKRYRMTTAEDEDAA